MVKTLINVVIQMNVIYIHFQVNLPKLQLKLNCNINP